MKTHKLVPVQCKHCTKEFLVRETYAHDLTTFFCCSDCYESYKINNPNTRLINNPFKTCIWCDQEFNFAERKVSKRQLFCSSKCYGLYNSKFPGIFQPKKIVRRITKICNHCGAEYSVHPYRVHSKFCSTKCHDLYRTKREQVICLYCGIEFTGQIGHNRKYCSAECAKNRTIQESKGEIEVKRFLDENNITYTSQYAIDLTNGFCKPDIVLGNKIIEFYGDYWHCSPRLFENEDQMNISIGMTAKEKRLIDAQRMYELYLMGYDTLIIWEYDWNTKNEECKLKILQFLETISGEDYEEDY